MKLPTLPWSKETDDTRRKLLGDPSCAEPGGTMKFRSGDRPPRIYESDLPTGTDLEGAKVLRCTGCQKDLPIEEFANAGFSVGTCIPCMKAQQRARVEALRRLM